MFIAWYSVKSLIFLCHKTLHIIARHVIFYSKPLILKVRNTPIIILLQYWGWTLSSHCLYYLHHLNIYCRQPRSSSQSSPSTPLIHLILVSWLNWATIAFGQWPWPSTKRWILGVLQVNMSDASATSGTKQEPIWRMILWIF